MTDLHTEGLQLGEALRAAEAITDPIQRFHALEAAHEQVVALAAAIRIAQGAALAELRPGTPWGVLAERAGVRSYQHVQKLVNNAARAAQREEQQ